MPSRTHSSAAPHRAKPLNGMVAFFGQAIKNFRSTGALLPSSPALAKAMTRSLRRATGPKRLLEVGPGTGPFTKLILKALRDGDELHIVEINPAFARHLDRALLQPFRKSHPRIVVELHIDPIESAPVHGRFDFIVCGLPFNNFEPKLVRSIFRRLMQLLASGGELAYFEYAGVRVMKGPLVGHKGRRKLKRIGAMGKALRRKHQGKRELVLNNMPPAVAVRLKR
jgi:phospholipid N-methyltransferase